MDLDELCTPTAFAPYYDCIDELHDTLVSITQRILLSFKAAPSITAPIVAVDTVAAAEDEGASAECINATSSTMNNASSNAKGVSYSLHYFLSEPNGHRLIEQLCGPDALHSTSFLPTLYDLLFTDNGGDTVSVGWKDVYGANRPVEDSVNYVSNAQQWFLVYLRSSLLSSLNVGCSTAYTSADKHHSFERSISVLDTVMELCDCHCYQLFTNATQLSDSSSLDDPTQTAPTSDSMGDPASVDIPYTVLTLYPSSSSSMIASQAAASLVLGQHISATRSEDQQLEWKTQWWAAIHKLLILYTDYKSTDTHRHKQGTLCTPALSDLFKQQLLSLMLSELHSIYRDILRLQPQKHHTQHQLKGKKKQGKQHSTNKASSYNSSNRDKSGSTNNTNNICPNDSDSKVHELYAFLPSIYETSLVYITAFKQWIIDTLVHTIYSQKGHNSDQSSNMLLLSIQVPLYMLKSITRDVVYDEDAEVIDIEKAYLTHWMAILHECSIQHNVHYSSSSTSNSNSSSGIAIRMQKGSDHAATTELPGGVPDEERVYDEYILKYNLLCKRYKEYMT